MGEGGAKCTAHKDNASLLQGGNRISHHALGSKLNFRSVPLGQGHQVGVYFSLRQNPEGTEKTRQGQVLPTAKASTASTVAIAKHLTERYGS